VVPGEKEIMPCHPEKTKLSIIIVGWNSWDYLEGCLKSIFKHPPSFNFEVIYVDNGSDDGSCEFICRQYPEIITIQNEENLGFQKANNKGLRICRGQYIILLNTDTLILPDSFDKMMAFMEAHPNVGAASPKCIYPDGRIQWSVSQFPSVRMLLWWLCARHRGLHWLLCFRKQTLPDSNETQVQDYAYGAFLTLRREVLDDVGFMDETFFSPGDDAGWSWRIKEKGWKVYYVAEVEVIHYGGKTENKRVKAFTADWLRAHRILLYQYRGAFNGLGGDFFFITDLILSFVKSVMQGLFRKKNINCTARPRYILCIFREVYFGDFKWKN
jgi:GT2 family glycosyltransferase